MADLITLTQQPVRQVTATNVLQPIYLSLDISGYDFLDMEAGIVGVEGAVTQFTLDLYTGMQVQTDDGWVSAGNLITQANPTTNSWYKVNFPNSLLRYIRWRVTTITAGTAVTFFIRGMARRYA
jgi:hypothetical protein